uniref:Uncharacterized protein n=1 Tax=Anolis carolinensis TaxID=28377 RepID=A0A803TCT8_ANOCA
MFWTTVIIMAHTTATLRNPEFTVTGLKISQKYRFRVAATNINGMSEYSESSAEIEPVERLGNKSIWMYSNNILYFFSITEIPDLELAEDLKKTVVVRAGGSLRLMVSVTGRPPPIITWNKKGVDLASRGIIDTTNSYTLLVVDKVNRYDAGKYVLDTISECFQKTSMVLVNPVRPQMLYWCQRFQVCPRNWRWLILQNLLYHLHGKNHSMTVAAD